MTEELSQEAKDNFAAIIKLSAKRQLLNGIGTVEFKKADGSIRTMRCTLIPDLLPLVIEEFDEGGNVKPKRHKPENPDVLSVWDLDNEGWRSFRYDSVISLKVDFNVDIKEDK